MSQQVWLIPSTLLIFVWMFYGVQSMHYRPLNIVTWSKTLFPIWRLYVRKSCGYLWSEKLRTFAFAVVNIVLFHKKDGCLTLMTSFMVANEESYCQKLYRDEETILKQIPSRIYFVVNVIFTLKLFYAIFVYTNIYETSDFYSTMF